MNHPWVFAFFCSLMTLTIAVAEAATESSQTARDEHLTRLKTLKEQQRALSETAKHLGISVPSDSDQGARQPSGDASSAHPLIKIHSDLSTLRISKGRFLFARTVNRLVVGNDGSPAVVEILPAQGALSGMRLLGTARAGGTDGRLAIEFKDLLFKGGKSLGVQATALDESGAYGVQAQVISQKALAIMGAMASSFVSGVAAANQSQSTNAFGFQQTQVTGRNAVLQGLAQTAADQSKRLIDEATSEKPILIVEAGTELSVLIQEEVRF